MKWKDGKVTSYHVTSSSPRKVKIRVNGILKEIVAERI
jgi:alpha-L-fucosidase 2